MDFPELERGMHECFQIKKGTQRVKGEIGKNLQHTLKLNVNLPKRKKTLKSSRSSE